MSDNNKEFDAIAGPPASTSEEYKATLLTSAALKDSFNSKGKDTKRPSSADIFKAAGKDIMVRNSISGAFKTLRDMTGGDDQPLEYSDLKKVRVLGQGAFAEVDEMVDAAGARFAVKKLKPQLADSDLQDFINETGLLKKLKNNNIVEFRGMGQYGQSTHELFIAQECMDGGSLKNILYKQGVTPGKVLYTRADALRWAIQMAKGLKYLHEAKPMVIHRDLKLENILLDNKDPKKANAKIADFGLHKVINQVMLRKGDAAEGAGDGEMSKSITRNAKKKEDPTYKMTGETGSLMYMAPEVLLGNVYNEKVDMFSFGVMFFEMLDYTMMVGKVSISGDPEELQNYAKRVSTGFRPGIPAHWPPNVGATIEKCWNQDANVRPSFAEVIPMLEALSGDIAAMDSKLKDSQGCNCTIM
mmetsp:Transcript_5088/g.16614  ORF Transcript_5088/g.16614 Transcript_5088/m.16614 type:complete len:414 (+) Transcript_5088:190-1431(+)